MPPMWAAPVVLEERQHLNMRSGKTFTILHAYDIQSYWLPSPEFFVPTCSIHLYNELGR